MQSFWRRHARKILLGHGTAIALLTTSMMVGTPKAILYFVAPEEKLQVGQTTDLVITLNAKVPINAVGITVVIPPGVEVVGIDAKDSFLDLWTEEAVMSKEGRELRFSGGALERSGISGVHAALTLSVRAKMTGEFEFAFKDTEVRAHDGTGDLVPTELRTFAISVSDTKTTAAPGGQAQTQYTNADFDGKNGVTLADMSILLKHLIGSYDSRFDLNHDGLLSLTDLSVFFSMMPNR